MTDFLTRVARRALGSRPAIQPLVVSRYAPALLPISEAAESETVSQLSAESSRMNVEKRSHVSSASLISKPGGQPSRQAVIEQNREDQRRRHDASSLSEHSESITPPSLGNDIQQRRAFTGFENAPPHKDAASYTNANDITVPTTKTDAPSLFESNRSAMHKPARQMESRMTVEPAIFSGSSEQQTTSPLENSTAYSAPAESSIDDASLVNVEKTDQPRRRVLRDGPTLQDSADYSAAEESAIGDQGLVTGEETGEPSRRISGSSQVLENTADDSTAEESSIVVEGMSAVENVGPSHPASQPVLSGSRRQMADNTPDVTIASPGLHHTEPNGPSRRASHRSSQIPETSHQEERNIQLDEHEDYTPEAELRSLVAPERSRREINSRDSFPEVFTQKPASSLPSTRNDQVESKPPLIRVTIGRVEVRAVTPPLPVVEPPPLPAQKLSLEEFLRQHNGRRQ